MVENSSVSFSDDELSVLKSALECFIKTKSIKGVSPQRKSSQDDIARSVLPRIFHFLKFQLIENECRKHHSYFI